MENLHVQINVNPVLYHKNPESTELGKAIVAGSITLICELGFEAFTFKKLGHKIGSPESSIYRYFENKHTLLVYLMSWYWTLAEYRIVFATNNIVSPKDRLRKALEVIILPMEESFVSRHVDIQKLNEIIFAESFKGYHTKEVDKENQQGYFDAYKQVTNRLARIILEITPGYPYPHMLASSVIEGAHQQKFFAEHLPNLTNSRDNVLTILEFYTHLVLSCLTKQ